MVEVLAGGGGAGGCANSASALQPVAVQEAMHANY